MIKFGFQRLEKKDDKEKFLYDFPYLEVCEKPEELHKVYKFKLVQARDLLEFTPRDNKLSWLFTEKSDEESGLQENTFYLINISSTDDGNVSPEIKINLGLDFNCKPLFERMEKLIGFDPTVKNYFKLVKVENIQGFPAVTLEPVTSDIVEPVNELVENLPGEDMVLETQSIL